MLARRRVDAPPVRWGLAVVFAPLRDRSLARRLACTHIRSRELKNTQTQPKMHKHRFTVELDFRRFLV